MKFNLQLFATKTTKQTGGSSTQSGSSTQGGSSTVGGSSSSTVGGSTSHTESTSNSVTNGSSQTVGHSQGGSHSQGQSVSEATGKVDSKTQSMRDQYTNDYTQNQKVDDAYNRLQSTLDQKPGFQSQYENKLNELYNEIMNQEKFTYDFNADAMYNMYKDKYTQSGKQAMQDTLAQAQAMNGGYGSSYAQTAGQQTYQNYLQELNNMLPTLRNQAYQEYQDEQSRKLQQYELTNDAYNREYGQYRDSVSDWQNDRSFNQSAYQDERNFDYSQYSDNRNFWNSEYWNERNAQQTSNNYSDSTNWSDSLSNTNSKSETNTKSSSDTNTSSWQNTNSSNWSNTNSWQNTNSWSNTSNWNNSTTDDGSGTTNNTSSYVSGLVKDAALGAKYNDSNYTSGLVKDATTAAARERDYAPYNISANGSLANTSEQEVNQEAFYLQEQLKGKNPIEQQAILNQFAKDMDMTIAEVRWLANKEL